MKQKKEKKKISTMLKNISFIFGYTWNVDKFIFFCYILQFCINGLKPFVPITFTALIFNSLQNKDSFATVLTFAVVMLILIALFDIASTILEHKLLYMTELLQKKLTLELGKHAMTMEYELLEKTQTLNLLSKATDATSITAMFSSINTIISNMITIVGLLGVICALQPLLLILVVIVVLTRIYKDTRAVKSFENWRDILIPILRLREYLAKISLKSIVVGKEVRINNLSDWLINKYTTVSKEIDDVAIKRSVEYNKLEAIPTLAEVIQELLLYLYLAYKVIFNGMQIGTFTLFFTSIKTFTDNISSIVTNLIQFNVYSTFLEDFAQCIKLCSSVQSVQHCKTVENNKNFTLRFEDVSFKYPNSEKVIIKNLSFEMQVPKKIAIIGHNGAGKSTLVKLICRFYKPTSGKITLNGQDINEINMDDYYKLLSIMFQDYQILPFTVADNISLDENADIARMEKAVNQVQFSQRLAQMSNSYRSYITKEFDENGQDLSGGEKQKLIMMRAIYKDAKIIIMDEPTASLDALAEYELYSNLNSLVNDKLCIFISHRLASTRFCDNIIVIQDGEIVQLGTHNQLLNQGGLYSELWNMQAKYYK